ncbi:MAG: hypothetical protein ACT4PV_05875 [Planctomycetaceae bacterium]
MARLPKQPISGGPLAIQRSLSIFSTSSPKARILILCLFFVVLGALWFGINSYAKSATTATRPYEPTQVVRPEGNFDLEHLPNFDPSMRERIRDFLPAERRNPDREALGYLMREALQTPAVRFYNKGLFPFVPGFAREIEKAAEPPRLQFFRFRGAIEFVEERIEESAEEDKGGPFEHYWRGRILVEGGDAAVRVSFISPFPPVTRDLQAPTVIPPTIELKEGWVRGRGLFVQRHLDAGPDGKEVPAFLFVVTGLERDYEARPVATLADVGLEVIQDDPALLETAQRDLLRKAYPLTLLRFVKYVEPLAGQAGQERRRAEGLEAGFFDTPKAYFDLIHNPGRHRAGYFAGKGTLLVAPFVQDDETEITVEPNDAGVEAYATGLVYTDAELIFQYAAPASLVAGLKSGARIRYEGFFYKTWVYPSKDGAERMVPWLVLTVLETVPPPARDRLGELIFAGAFMLVIGVVIFLAVREDKTKAAYRASRRKRILEPRPEAGE